MTKQKIINALFVIFPIALVAVLGSVFVNIGMEWFNGLTKPTQWIPNIVIPIVWSVVYLSFAVVLIIWQNKTEIPLSTKILLIVNGVLNVLWCLTFFALKLTFVGNIVIILNLIAGIILWLNIFKQQKLFSYILSIYPVWLSVATTLNLAMWILN